MLRWSPSRRNSAFRRLSCCLVVACLLPGCDRAERPAVAPADAAAPTVGTGLSPAAAARAPSGEDDWRIPARDWASTRYSPLDGITRENVQRLRAAWTFSTGVLRGHEAAPIVAEGFTRYSNPLPHVLILTAIVVGVATLALGLALAVRIREAYGSIEEDEILEQED